MLKLIDYKKKKRSHKEDEKIVAMILLGGMLLGEYNPVISHAETMMTESQDESITWTESEIEKDFVEKYIGEGSYINEKFIKSMCDVAQQNLYITEDEREKVMERIEELETTEGVLYSVEEDGVLITFCLDEENSILKTLSYEGQEEGYFLVNKENEQVTAFTPDEWLSKVSSGYRRTYIYTMDRNECGVS